MTEGWDIEKAIQNIKRRCHHKPYKSDVHGFDSNYEFRFDEELIIDDELKSVFHDNSREPFDASEFVETEMMPSLSPRAQVKEKLSKRQYRSKNLTCLECDYTTTNRPDLQCHMNKHKKYNKPQYVLPKQQQISQLKGSVIIIQPKIVQPQTVQIVQPDGQLVQAAINNAYVVLPQQLRLNQTQTPFPITPMYCQPQIIQSVGQAIQQQQHRQINQLQTQHELQPKQQLQQQKQTTEDVQTKNNSESNPYYSPQFYVGRAFTSYKDLCKAKEIYEQQKRIMLPKRYSRTIMNDYKRGKRKNTIYNKDLIFSEIAYQCKFGQPIKRKRKELDEKGKPKKKRNRPSQCIQCPFSLKLSLSKDNQSLRVIKIHEEHNHICSSSNFRSLREQLGEETFEETKILLALDVDIKKIQRHLCSKGKMVTNKGLHNLMLIVKKEKNKGKQSFYSKDKMFSMKDLQHILMNEDKGSNSFEDVLALMMNHQDISFEIMITKESDCQGVFFQTEDMKLIFDMSSEMVVFDTTYKLSEHKMPLYLMLCLDGNGESVVIALALAQYENKETLSWIAKSFRKYNPNFTKVKCIMGDKDNLERQELLNHFPNAQLYNCKFFNTIKTFKKEVTNTNMNISAEEREFCLEMFLNIVFSKDKATCDSNITLLKDMVPEKVVEYFTKNWEPIKDDWTKGVSTHKTISKLEIFNGKLKSLIDSYSSMTKFVIDLLNFIYYYKRKRDQRESTL